MNMSASSGFVHAPALTRRGLLRSAGIVGLVALAGGALPAHVANHASWLRRSSYVGLHGTAFRAQLAGRESWVPLTLRHVSDLPVAANVAALRDHEDAFVLSFDGPDGDGDGTHVQAKVAEHLRRAHREVLTQM